MMKFPVTRAKRRIAHLLRPLFPRSATFLEFPASPMPRYGWGQPQYPHFYKACEEKRTCIESLLTSFLQFTDQILRIPRRSESDPVNPIWDQEMFPTLDAIALYCTLCLHRPALYVEIGAGHSTRFARRAIRDNALP